MFTDRNGNKIDDNSPDKNEEVNSTEITGVSTGMGNIETNNSRAMHTETNNTGTNDNVLEIINNNINTLESIDMPDSTGMNTQGENTFDIKETHTTHGDEEGTHEEPTKYDEQMIEEMNATNMQHDSEIENEDDAIDTADENPESPQYTQMDNTVNHGYN